MIPGYCRMFDPENCGMIEMSMFRQILKTKHVSEADIADMIEGKI